MADYKTTWSEKFGYGIGAVGLDLSYGLFYSYLANYLTDVLLMPAAFLLILTPIARIWDGINDPMMGTIVDHTKTKMGKYRPWIICGAVCNSVILVLLFSNPGIKLGSPWLYVYVAVMYILWGMTNTMADIPYWSMVPSFTTDPKDRNMISTVARTFSGLGQGIVTIFTPLALVYLGKGTTEAEKKVSSAGYSRWAMICAVLLVVFALICTLKTKERNVVYSESKAKFSFKEVFGVLKSNDQLVAFMIFAMISNAGFYLVSGVNIYYFKTVVGDITLQSKFAIFGAVGSFLGLFVIPVMQKKFTKRTIYQCCLSVAAAGYIVMFIGAFVLKNMWVINIAYVVANIGTGSMFVNQTIFLADIVDYGEYKTGSRHESITFSMKGFLQKMAYTVQTILLFGGLLISGYQGDLLTKNSAFSKDTITFMTFALPPILMILSLIYFSKKFKIHGELAEKIQTSIADKRAKESE